MTTKIHHVYKSAKDQGVCGRCGDPLPVGSEYRHATPGFRSHNKLVRCMKPECTFQRSELTTSKLADVYAAQEDAESDMQQAGSPEDVRQILEDCANRVEETAQEYRDAAENFGGEGEMAERADVLDEYASELQNFNVEDYAVEEDEEEEEEPEDNAPLSYDPAVGPPADANEMLKECIEAAIELIGSLEL